MKRQGGEILKKKLLSNFAAAIISLLLPINAYAAMYLQPGGQAIGVKMYTDGLVVVDVCSVTDTDGRLQYCKGIVKGDVILSADNKKLTQISDLKNIISSFLFYFFNILYHIMNCFFNHFCNNFYSI